MDSILTTFLLFLAALTALLTYIIIPRVPVVALVSVASVGLAAGVWWHWTQFGVEYRMSTWQEQLRNYASYAMLLVVILLSYGFYVFTAGSANTGSNIGKPFRNITAGSSRLASSESEIAPVSEARPNLVSAPAASPNIESASADIFE